MTDPEHPAPQPASDYLSPGAWIDAARAAHPAFKYAIVVGGLGALVAIVSRFGASPATLIFGIILVVVLMVLFLVFAQAAQLRKNTLSFPSLILVWSFLSLSIATALLLFTSAFFDAPLPFKQGIIRSLGLSPQPVLTALTPSTAAATSTTPSPTTPTPPTPTPAPATPAPATPVPITPAPIGVHLTSINVHHTALPGQDWRASENFSISLPAGMTKLVFQVPEPASPHLLFSISRDRSFAHDQEMATNLRNGSTINAFSGSDLYIGGVTNATAPFVVNIYAK